MSEFRRCTWRPLQCPSLVVQICLSVDFSKCRYRVTDCEPSALDWFCAPVTVGLSLLSNFCLHRASLSSYCPKIVDAILDNVSFVVCSEFLVLPSRIKMLTQYHFTVHGDQPSNLSISSISACLFLLHSRYATQTDRREWKQSNKLEMSSLRIYCVAWNSLAKLISWSSIWSEDL